MLFIISMVVAILQMWVVISLVLRLRWERLSLYARYFQEMTS